jgi:hypothetical protein
MINLITGYHYPVTQQSAFDSEELTALQLAARTAAKCNEVVNNVNGYQADIDSREKSALLSTNRKLSATGDFTGSINGKSTTQVLLEINEGRQLSAEVLELINQQEIITHIIDGGLFTDVPGQQSYDGGLF